VKCFPNTAVSTVIGFAVSGERSASRCGTSHGRLIRFATGFPLGGENTRIAIEPHTLVCQN